MVENSFLRTFIALSKFWKLS